MITELILNLIYQLISLLLTPIQLIFQPLGSMAGLIEILAYGSIFIPMGTLALCLTTWIGFHFTRFVVVALNWIIAKIPTVS